MEATPTGFTTSGSGGGATAGISQKPSMKKPFDWMSDEQYQNLLVSLSAYSFLQANWD